MFLVPEIGLTPLLSRLVVSRFPGQVSLLHSGMSAGERFDQWNRIREGESKVVVGTRSAVFAPLKDLRLIVIDEEQDSSYKQDESPCYHAREVAWHRVQQTNGVLLLGSATPCIETYYAATQEEDGVLFPSSGTDRGQADAARHHGGYERRVQDARQERRDIHYAAGRTGRLHAARGAGDGSAQQARICAHASVPRLRPRLHLPGLQRQHDVSPAGEPAGLSLLRPGKEVPSVCISCGGPYIHYAGVGTEQLEGILRTLLPKARIARLDRDTARRRGTLRSVLFGFAERELDILVGTQILAKGHDFPDVTMVGVLAADAGLSFPDFRSAERTFQLLTQVAGRAGRGNAPGRVVIQSFYPDNYAMHFAQKQDYRGFFEKEIEYRKLMGYPPFRSLIQIVVSDPDDSKAMRECGKNRGRAEDAL